MGIPPGKHSGNMPEVARPNNSSYCWEPDPGLTSSYQAPSPTLLLLFPLSLSCYKLVCLNFKASHWNSAKRTWKDQCCVRSHRSGRRREPFILITGLPKGN